MNKEEAEWLMRGIYAITGGQAQNRNIAHDIVEGIEVSTIWASDIEQFETAVWVSDETQGHLRIHPAPVERYDTEEAANEGHAKWMDLVKDANQVTMLGYGPLVDEEIVKLR